MSRKTLTSNNLTILKTGQRTFFRSRNTWLRILTCECSHILCRTRPNKAGACGALQVLEKWPQWPQLYQGPLAYGVTGVGCEGPACTCATTLDTVSKMEAASLAILARTGSPNNHYIKHWRSAGLGESHLAPHFIQLGCIHVSLKMGLGTGQSNQGLQQVQSFEIMEGASRMVKISS